MIMTNNVKSLKKQLMAAIAMVVVAAIALSSATYAWFVNNSQVTATNVSVKAATAYSLLISHKNGENASWGTTTELNKTLDHLTPVSTIGEVNEGDNATAITLSAKTDSDAAVGIGDGTKIAVGDVRFVTNTAWSGNYATGVSEVSKSSKTTPAANDDTDDNYYYFYSDTVYLKAAQAGDIYLDSTGIGIMWAKFDTTTNERSETPELISFEDFAALTIITPADNSTDEIVDKYDAYNADLLSAQDLLKTMRIGLLVSQKDSDDKTTRVWHEYQLIYSKTSNAVKTTGGSTFSADGITKAVSAAESVGEGHTVATVDTPVEKDINGVKLASKTIDDYAIKGSSSAIASATTTDDIIATAAVNEEIQVDIYVWMEGCDEDTVAANISSFSEATIEGLQLGFCLGAVPASE
jgi:hypothetical protein